MFAKPLADHQYDRALRWLKSRARSTSGPPPRHIAEKIDAQHEHLRDEIRAFLGR